MRNLTDSTYVIDALTHQPFASELLPHLLQEGLALSAVSHMELWDGVHGSREPERAARELRSFLRGVRVLPFTARVALRTATLRREMRRQGLPLAHRMLDVLIAGTALTHGLVLVTSDVDFADIPGLTLLNPRAARLPKA